MSGFSAVAMYGFTELQDAWNRLYRSAAQHVESAPSTLSWDRDTVASWTDPDLALGQSCGWPLVTQLADRVHVIGTFTIAGKPSYRSVIIARRSVPLDRFAGSTAAINGFDSLSGWVSLRAALPDVGEVRETGSHRASILAVAAGDADIAAIDALTWHHAQRLWPQETIGIAVVGEGPTIPCLPLITATRDAVDPWRRALSAAVAERGEDCVVLGISGFVTLELSDYRHALAGLV